MSVSDSLPKGAALTGDDNAVNTTATGDGTAGGGGIVPTTSTKGEGGLPIAVAVPGAGDVGTPLLGHHPVFAEQPPLAWTQTDVPLSLSYLAAQPMSSYPIDPAAAGTMPYDSGLSPLIRQPPVYSYAPNSEILSQDTYAGRPVAYYTSHADAGLYETALQPKQGEIHAFDASVPQAATEFARWSQVEPHEHQQLQQQQQQGQQQQQQQLGSEYGQLPQPIQTWTTAAEAGAEDAVVADDTTNLFRQFNQMTLYNHDIPQGQWNTVTYVQSQQAPQNPQPQAWGQQAQPQSLFLRDARPQEFGGRQQPVKQRLFDAPQSLSWADVTKGSQGQRDRGGDGGYQRGNGERHSQNPNRVPLGNNNNRAERSSTLPRSSGGAGHHGSKSGNNSNHNHRSYYRQPDSTSPGGSRHLPNNGPPQSRISPSQQQQPGDGTQNNIRSKNNGQQQRYQLGHSLPFSTLPPPGSAAAQPLQAAGTAAPFFQPAPGIGQGAFLGQPTSLVGGQRFPQRFAGGLYHQQALPHGFPAEYDPSIPPPALPSHLHAQPPRQPGAAVYYMPQPPPPPHHHHHQQQRFVHPPGPPAMQPGGAPFYNPLYIRPDGTVVGSFPQSQQLPPPYIINDPQFRFRPAIDPRYFGGANFYGNMPPPLFFDSYRPRNFNYRGRGGRFRGRGGRPTYISSAPPTQTTSGTTTSDEAKEEELHNEAGSPSSQTGHLTSELAHSVNRGPEFDRDNETKTPSPVGDRILGGGSSAEMSGGTKTSNSSSGGEGQDQSSSQDPSSQESSRGDSETTAAGGGGAAAASGDAKKADKDADDVDVEGDGAGAANNDEVGSASSTASSSSPPK